MHNIEISNYLRLPPEERQLPDAINPMCEVFPKGSDDDWR